MAISHTSHLPRLPQFDVFAPIRRLINNIEIQSDRTAHLICKLIPCNCPFERDITLLGYTLHIPPLCKLNPLYNELVYLRFRALSYLTDVCHEDVAHYIC